VTVVATILCFNFYLVLLNVLEIVNRVFPEDTNVQIHKGCCYWIWLVGSYRCDHCEVGIWVPLFVNNSVGGVPGGGPSVLVQTSAAESVVGILLKICDDELSLVEEGGLTSQDDPDFIVIC
jgi:hypothetical protein